MSQHLNLNWDIKSWLAGGNDKWYRWRVSVLK
jgi:hypothetical protein